MIGESIPDNKGGKVRKETARQKEMRKKTTANTNVVVLFKPSDNCRDNLEKFISEAKKIQPALFKFSCNWNDSAWDLKGNTSTVRVGLAGGKKNVLFTQANGKSKKVKVPVDEQVPFREPFSSFAKAVVTDRHNVKPKTHSNHMECIGALRLIYMQFPEAAPCVTQLNLSHFTKASRIVLQRDQEKVDKGGSSSPGQMYKVGNQLAALAKLIDKYQLTPVRLNWENPFSRPNSYGGATHERGSDEAKERRANKLPKTFVLLYLAALWNHYDELDEKDKAPICIAIIYMLSGFRMDEGLGLDINCVVSRGEYEKQAPELDPETGVYARLLEIRVLAKKTNHWESKIVPMVAVDIIFDAVDRLKALSAAPRRTAQTMLQECKWDALAEYDDDHMLTPKELMPLLGLNTKHKTSNTIAAIERYGIERDPNALRIQYRVGDIHERFTDAYKERMSELVNGYGGSSFSIQVWEFLSLRYRHQFAVTGIKKVFAEPIIQGALQDFFRGRDYITSIQKSGVGGESRRLLSVFERYIFPEFSEEDIETVHSHQFRHLLNTLMQEEDAFTQEDIAKNFLRHNTKDNVAYNHQIEPSKFVERTRDFQDKVRAEINIDSASAATAYRTFPLLTHDELQHDLDDSGSYHFMDIGRCRHDYTQGPCGMHYACLRNCINYKRCKGDQGEIEKITIRRDRALMQMDLAREDAGDEITGANNWYLNQQELVNGCIQALAIEKDERFSIGEIVQVFPNGIDRCEEVESDE